MSRTSFHNKRKYRQKKLCSFSSLERPISKLCQKKRKQNVSLTNLASKNLLEIFWQVFVKVFPWLSHYIPHSRCTSRFASFYLSFLLADKAHKDRRNAGNSDKATSEILVGVFRLMVCLQSVKIIKQ